MTDIRKTARKAMARDAMTASVTTKKRMTSDSFQNFAAKLGVGQDEILSSSTYSFNPISRNRMMLEWMYRGSWIAGIAVDAVADDMIRAGVEISGSLEPEEIEVIQDTMTALGCWSAIGDNIRWARLFGGSLAFMMIDGQDPRTPLRIETVGRDQFKGLLILDRWQVDPQLESTIQDFGPSIGMPEYYRVTGNAPAMQGKVIHHSRLIRFDGIQLPHQQRLQENMWGISVLERLYDRMVSYDSASLGASKLVYKSYLRTLKIEGLRDTVGEGGPALDGIITYVDMMRRFQSIDGITMLDKEDEFQTSEHGAFSGLSDVLLQFGQQLSGALQIPLVRLFGQSPSGLNSTGESDLRMYYDGIAHKQIEIMHTPITRLIRIVARSCGLKDTDLRIKFRPLWQLSDAEKVDIAEKGSRTIESSEGAGIIDRATALKELRQLSHVTGMFTNITDNMISEAETEGPPLPEDVEVEQVKQNMTTGEPGDEPKNPDEDEQND